MPRPNRVVRMWHKRDGDKFCHAWDVDEAAFKQWRAGTVPLSAHKVYLPGGGHPPIGTQVRCGSCGSVDVVPTEMKQEVI